VLFPAGSVPLMDCPVFVGPAVVGRTQVEFYCDVQTAVTDRRARFDVVFLFDCETDVDVPVVTVDTSSPRATLHERHLGTRLHKTVLQRICVQLRASADSVTLPAFAAARRAAAPLLLTAGLQSCNDRSIYPAHGSKPTAAPRGRRMVGQTRYELPV